MSKEVLISVKGLNKIKRPLFMSAIVCGFPSPAEDFVEKYLNPEDLYYQHPEATFFLRVSGDSMEGAGIFDGDILVIDTSLMPRDNDIVIACINGEFTCKYYSKESNRISLIPANKKYKTIYVNPSMDFEIYGVVTWLLGRKRR